MLKKESLLLFGKILSVRSIGIFQFHGSFFTDLIVQFPYIYGLLGRNNVASTVDERVFLKVV